MIDIKEAITKHWILAYLSCIMIIRRELPKEDESMKGAAVWYVRPEPGSQ